MENPPLFFFGNILRSQLTFLMKTYEYGRPMAVDREFVYIVLAPSLGFGSFCLLLSLLGAAFGPFWDALGRPWAPLDPPWAASGFLLETGPSTLEK